mmetsp:Transcript_9378/g.16971  ORF Transcript_9378/g.16971 Transcript_9378/m.16971 type:complete len:550 (-) Transcript_9378:9-1658(-)
MEDEGKAPEETCEGLPQSTSAATQCEATSTPNSEDFLKVLQTRVIAAARLEVAEVCAQTLANCTAEFSARLKQAEDRLQLQMQQEAESRADSCDHLRNLISQECDQRRAEVERIWEHVGGMAGAEGKVDLVDSSKDTADGMAFNEARFRTMLQKMDEAEGRAQKLQSTLCSLESMCGDELHTKLRGLESELAILVSMVGTLRDQHHQVVKPMSHGGVDDGMCVYPNLMRVSPLAAPHHRNYSLSVTNPPQRHRSGPQSPTGTAKVLPPDRKSLGSVAPRSPAGAPKTNSGNRTNQQQGVPQPCPVGISKSHSVRKIITTASASSFSVPPSTPSVAPGSYGCPPAVPSAAVCHSPPGEFPTAPPSMGICHSPTGDFPAGMPTMGMCHSPPTDFPPAALLVPAVGVCNAASGEFPPTAHTAGACRSPTGEVPPIVPPLNLCPPVECQVAPQLVRRAEHAMVVRMQSAPSLARAPKASSEIETNAEHGIAVRVSTQAQPGRTRVIMHGGSHSPRRSVSPPPPTAPIIAGTLGCQMFGSPASWFDDNTAPTVS